MGYVGNFMQMHLSSQIENLNRRHFNKDIIKALCYLINTQGGTEFLYSRIVLFIYIYTSMHVLVFLTNFFRTKRFILLGLAAINRIFPLTT